METSWAETHQESQMEHHQKNQMEHLREADLEEALAVVMPVQILTIQVL